MTDEMILEVIDAATKVFGEGAREVALHLGETMLARPLAGVGAYFGVSEGEIAAARPDEVMRLEVRLVDEAVAKTEVWLYAL